MDYETGIVGIKRGISYQSLSEILYIEPHSGISSGSPSKDQIRRAIKGLERAGLLQTESLNTKLIFRCILAHLDYFVQNKPPSTRHRKPPCLKTPTSLYHHGIRSILRINAHQ